MEIQFIVALSAIHQYTPSSTAQGIRDTTEGKGVLEENRLGLGFKADTFAKAGASSFYGSLVRSTEARLGPETPPPSVIQLGFPSTAGVRVPECLRRDTDKRLFFQTRPRRISSPVECLSIAPAPSAKDCLAARFVVPSPRLRIRRFGRMGVSHDGLCAQ
jgi:hypothetical protein